MTAVLIALVVVAGLSGWWLSHQRLMSKPWMESGLDNVVDGTDRVGFPKSKVGLIVFLAIVGFLFALFTSGHFMRQELADWRTLPLPRVLWVNTGLLILGSISLQRALFLARKHDMVGLRFWLGAACIVTAGFLLGQMLAWQQLAANGFVLAANPANSFFYLLTGLHGLHIFGGLVALGRATVSARSDAVSLAKLQLSIDLCALYWHFLLFVWVVLVVVMLGWARDPFIISHQ
jgi:cytochrome c oxidase subunit 3